MRGDRPGPIYGSFAEPAGAALYGSTDALNELATLLREGWEGELVLRDPPEEVREGDAVKTLRLRPIGDGPVVLRSAGDGIEILGGPAARRRFASSLDSLAAAPRTADGVSRELDLEYFPGHGFLGEDSIWMTILTIDDVS